MNIMEITDRYDALGIPLPDPQTVCKGKCEGTGFVPVYIEVYDKTGAYPGDSEYDPVLRIGWKEMHDKYPHECDGWHFVTCPTCEGTGKRYETL